MGAEPLGTPPNSNGHGSLSESLGPALIEECGGRLSAIDWFQTVWQHGGATTGFATWRADDGEASPVLVKLPVGPAEYSWTTRLGMPANGADQDALCTPRVLAAGQAIGGYDLAWLVLERFEGPTLTTGWCRESMEDLINAAADFQARAMRAGPAPERPPPPPDWATMIAKAREIAKASHMAESQRWNEALHQVQRALPRLSAKWAARPVNAWCHGDLHPGNAMHRTLANGERRRCVLIDLALVHAGHWVEDAVYLERQFWGKPEALHEINPVKALAHGRRARSLPTEGDYGLLANVRRVLMAACVPCFLAHEGHPRYVHAALEIIERLLPQVSK